MSSVLTWLPGPALDLFADALPEQRARRFPARTDSTVVGTVKRERDFQECISSVENYRNLPTNWDRYGGNPAHQSVVEFAVNLLAHVSLSPEIPAPLVRPISGGVFVEWRFAKSRLYFEIDDESVLRYLQDGYGEETLEDSSFNIDKAAETIVRFHQ